jgi:hypothetical protein
MAYISDLWPFSTRTGFGGILFGARDFNLLESAPC